MRARMTWCLLFCAIALMHVDVAKADGWLFCDNCTTTDQFKQVAKSSTTVAGTTDWAVGNRVTGKVMFVTVMYTPPGQNPAFTTYDNAIYSRRGGRSEIIEYPNAGPAVLAGVRSSSQSLGGGTASAFAVAASTAQNSQFSAIVRISSTSILMNAPPGNDFLDSLAGAKPEVFGPLLWEAMTVNNPAWNNNALSDSASLWGALKLAQGKGPIACMVFANGDSGCFQMNPVDSKVPAYIQGSGRDRYGNHIERGGTGSLPGGGTTMVVKPGDPNTHWNVGTPSPSGYIWLFCEFVGGKLDHCWLQSDN